MNGYPTTAYEGTYQSKQSVDPVGDTDMQIGSWVDCVQALTLPTDGQNEVTFSGSESWRKCSIGPGTGLHWVGG